MRTSKTVSSTTIAFRFRSLAATFCAAFITALPAFAQLPAPATGAPKAAPAKPNAYDKSATSSVPYLPPSASDDDLTGVEDGDQIAGEVEPKPAEGSTPSAPPQPGAPLPLSIGGVSIRGLNDIAVIKKIRAAHSKKLRAFVELWDGEKAHRLRRDALGASIPYYKLLADARKISKSGGDVPLRFEIDFKQAARAMKTLASRINHAPSNASLDIDAEGKVLLLGGEGVSLATDGSAHRVVAALQSEPPKSYVELVIARQPAGSNNLRQFKYLLAEYSTPYDAGIRGRTTNLKLSAKLVNGEVVERGKVFSTNKAIGPRNAANGWKEAKMFMNGQVVNGVGAGICQCATTIYNAALLANLPIVERYQHSFRVNYVPPSRDAAIYQGQKDLKFRNNTKGPIHVQTLVKDGRFHVRLYGIEPVKENVAIESKIISQKKGTRSEAYRVVEVGGKEKRELLSRDSYKVKPR